MKIYEYFFDKDEFCERERVSCGTDGVFFEVEKLPDDKLSFFYIGSINVFYIPFRSLYKLNRNQKTKMKSLLTELHIKNPEL